MNRLIYLSTVAVQALVSLILLPVLTHNLAKADYGTIALIATTQQLATMVIALGVPQLVSRSEVLRQSTGHGFGTVLAAVVLGGIGLIVLTRSPESVIVPLAAGNAIIALSLSRLRVLDRAVPWAVLSIVAGPAAQVLGVVVVVHGGGLNGYLTAWLVGLLGTTVLSLVWADRVWFDRPRRTSLLELGRLGAPLSVAAAGMVMFTSGDRIVVGHVLGRAEAGQYQAFYALGNIACFATTALFSYWMGRILTGDRRSALHFRLEVAVLAVGGAVAGTAASFILLPASYAPAQHWPIAALAALAAIPYGLTLEQECHFVRTLNTSKLGLITPLIALLAILFTILVTWATSNLILVAMVTPVTYLVLALAMRHAARKLVDRSGTEPEPVPPDRSPHDRSRHDRLPERNGRKPMRGPKFSIVVPTYNRRDVLLGTVAALSRAEQPWPVELIVVVDGSEDGSAEAIEALDLPMAVRVIRQQNAGAAAARNRGAAEATGEFVLFLDDDMTADSRLLVEHEILYSAGADAVIGDIPLHPDSPHNLLTAGVETWTRLRRERLAGAGGKLTIDDLLTGQLSVRAEVFRQIGGFDPEFTSEGQFGGEDTDLGYRLLTHGADVRYTPKAISYQRYVVTPQQHMRQWRGAGRADALLTLKHPEMAGELARRCGGPLRASMVSVARSWLPTAVQRGVVRLVVGRATRGCTGPLTRYLYGRVREAHYWDGRLTAGGHPHAADQTLSTDFAVKQREPGSLTRAG